jgi:hypothetical protein
MASAFTKSRCSSATTSCLDAACHREYFGALEECLEAFTERLHGATTAHTPRAHGYA